MSQLQSTTCLLSAPVALTSPDREKRDRRPTGHITALDGVRGLAILLVLIYHFTMGMSGRASADRLFLRLTTAGWCGVDLFFVLSGFLITGILYDSKATPHRFRNFYARRALRIFPLYYGVLILIFAALRVLRTRIGGFAGVEDAWPWLWLYGTNIRVALGGQWFPLSHFWSLAVEEHFYLIWPLIVFSLSRRTALRICGAVVVLSLAVRIWLVSQGAVLGAYCLTICRMDALAIGGAIALLMRSETGWDAILRRARWLTWTSLAALVMLGGWRKGLAFHDPVIQTIGYPLLDVFFASMMVAVLASPKNALLSHVFNHAALRHLGRYSYGLYVYNSIVLLILEGASVTPPRSPIRRR